MLYEVITRYNDQQIRRWDGIQQRFLDIHKMFAGNFILAAGKQFFVLVDNQHGLLGTQFMQQRPGKTIFQRYSL